MICPRLFFPDSEMKHTSSYEPQRVVCGECSGREDEKMLSNNATVREQSFSNIALGVLLHSVSAMAT